MIRKATIRLEADDGEVDLHYRIGGEGPPLLLLHPSPLSSGFMVPLMMRLGTQATVMAIDTPGYGASSAIANAAGDLSVYASVLRKFVDRLGLARYAVYGSATGAQLAIELARADPERVSGIVLDNAASFTDDQRMAVTEGYFPDLSPRPDGSHLSSVWQIAHDSMLFFPWHKPSDDNRISPVLGPLEAMQAHAMGYLEAGSDYHLAYRAAFENERAERLAAVTVPVVVVRWHGGILRRYADQLDEFHWADNLRMAFCESDPEARWQCIQSELASVLPESHSSAGDLERQEGSFHYVDFEGGQLCCHRSTKGSGRLVIHPLGGSATTIEPQVIEPGDFIFDLPGHGGSDVAEYGLSTCVNVSRYLMDEFSLTSVAAIGDGIFVADQITTDAVQLLELNQQSPPDLALQSGGGHLLEGWHWLRRRHVNLSASPTQLTKELVQLFRARDAHNRLYADIHGNQAGKLR